LYITSKFSRNMQCKQYKHKYTTEQTLPNANLSYQVALDWSKMDRRQKPIPLSSVPFARAVMVVQWYDQLLNSLATRVWIPPLRASGNSDTVWVLSPQNLHNRQRSNALECQPSLPSRSRSAQISGQLEKAEANCPEANGHGPGHHRRRGRRRRHRIGNQPVGAQAARRRHRAVTRNYSPWLAARRSPGNQPVGAQAARRPRAP
jgi:hypothetical protein